jgi:hypothetical protein
MSHREWIPTLPQESSRMGEPSGIGTVQQHPTPQQEMVAFKVRTLTNMSGDSNGLTLTVV